MTNFEWRSTKQIRMLELIQELYQVDKLEATALASVAVDLRITQIVNGVKGVHAVLPHETLRKI